MGREYHNFYDAKFFIGQLVRVIRGFDEDIGKVGNVESIVDERKIGGGFLYSLSPSDTRKRAWFDENELDFVEKSEREEWEKHKARNETAMENEMDELTGMMKAWFADMIDTAIKECQTGVENEQTWADGARTADEKMMHEANSRENQAYVAFLQKLREKYVG